MKRITIAFLILSFALSGCLPSAPEVIERKCTLPEINPPPKISAISWHSDCGPYYRCIDEQNYNQLKINYSLYETDGEYCRDIYQRTKERCQ